jgi:hypothetical protein
MQEDVVGGLNHLPKLWMQTVDAGILMVYRRRMRKKKDFILCNILFLPMRGCFLSLRVGYRLTIRLIV